MADDRNIDDLLEDYYEDPDLNAVDDQGIPLTPAEQGQLEALAQAQELAEEDVPAEITVTDPLDLIPMAIAEARLIQMTYQNRKGETKMYTLEPYEVGGNRSHPAGYLWAFDRNAGTIKSFFLSNILEVTMLEEEFIVRSF